MPASAPAPIGTSLPLVFQAVWTRTNEPIFKHVSVPGTYQKPAPYRLQTLTYSTGLALTGRSAACAPATATKPAAEPRRNVFTNFIVTPLVCPSGHACRDGWTLRNPHNDLAQSVGTQVDKARPRRIFRSRCNPATRID